MEELNQLSFEPHIYLDRCGHMALCLNCGQGHGREIDNVIWVVGYFHWTSVLTRHPTSSTSG